MTSTAEAAVSEDGAEAASGTITVLHVDDDPDFRDLTACYLEHEADAMTILSARSAAAALSLLRDGNTRVDCVVSDYDMPGRDGLEFLAAVRAEFPELPFILFTGKGSEEVASEAISAGVTEYLRKRTGSEQFELLCNRVENAVEKTRAERRAAKRQERLGSIVDNAPVVLFALDAEGTFTLSTGKALESLGLDPGEVVGESIFDVYGDHSEIVRSARRALAGEPVHATVELDGRTFDTWYQPVTAAGEVESVIGVSVEVTELTRYRRVFEALQETGRDLLRADDDDDVADLAVESATEVLDAPAASCWLARNGDLRLRATTAGTPDGCPADEGTPHRRALETGETHVVADATDEPTPGPGDPASLLAVPLADHGVLAVDADDPGAFEPVDRQAASLLAATVAAALETVDR